MPNPTRTPSASKVVVTIICDGGTTQDQGDRLQREFPNQKHSPRIDLLKLPEAIEKELQREFPGASVTAPKERRIFYNLGAASANSFLEKMQTEWSIETLP